jgi:formate hydrogenlyase subunit 3/multisubunit Na+/H+ antiporter MnhD subunit
MVPLLVFYGNVIAAAALFTKHWQEGDLKHGILAVTYLALIFSVGWSMSTFLVKLFVSEKGFAIWLDRDALSLLFLAIVEAIFFTAQMRRKAKRSRLSGT